MVMYSVVQYCLPPSIRVGRRNNGKEKRVLDSAWEDHTSHGLERMFVDSTLRHFKTSGRRLPRK